MKKILIGLLVSCIASSSIFALEITQGKLLRHKEWTTGNIIKATYTTKANLFSADIEKLISKKDHISSSIYTFSGTDTQNGKVLEPATAIGYSSVMMMNGSKNTKTYLYTLETCITPVEGQYNCAIYQDTIDVEPNSMAFRTENPSIQFTFDKAGAYPVAVKAIVEELKTPSSSASLALGKMHISE